MSAKSRNRVDVQEVNLPAWHSVDTTLAAECLPKPLKQKSADLSREKVNPRIKSGPTILVLASPHCALADCAAKLSRLYKVTTVESAKAASRYLGKMKFDLIIVDETTPREISTAVLNSLPNGTPIYRPERDIRTQKFLNEVIHRIESRFLDPQAGEQSAKKHMRQLRKKLGVPARIKTENLLRSKNDS